MEVLLKRWWPPGLLRLGVAVLVLAADVLGDGGPPLSQADVHTLIPSGMAKAEVDGVLGGPGDEALYDVVTLPARPGREPERQGKSAFMYYRRFGPRHASEQYILVVFDPDRKVAQGFAGQTHPREVRISRDWLHKVLFQACDACGL